MRTIKLISALTFTSILLIFNTCKKDPCKEITCLNDGVCVDGKCDCTEGYYGSKCEDYNACHNVTCHNWGICVDGQCDCLPAWSGPDCSQQVTPSHIMLTELVLYEFPALNNGNTWDDPSEENGNPDILMVIRSGNDYAYTTEIIENATPGSVYLFLKDIDLPLWNQNDNHTIQLWDIDPGGTIADQSMGHVEGKIYEPDNGLPNTIRFYNPNRNIDVTLMLEYIF